MDERERGSSVMGAWAALLQRAAGSPVHASEGRFASVAFVVTGIIQGAVHAPLAPGEEPVARTRAFAEALVEEARRVGQVLRVVWSAPTHGPHEGEPVEGLVLALESLDLPPNIDPLHITQTIDAARGTAEAAVLAIAEQMGQLAELARAQLEQLRRLPQGGAALGQCVQRAEAVRAGANAVLHQLQFQDRTNQMLAQATQQAVEVIRLAGLQERALTDSALNRVGQLGRELDPAASKQDDGGTFELF